VKLFLKKPNDSQAQGLVQKIFQSATAENDNPDVRDRAYVYWRLLSSNAQIAQNVVLSEKPPIKSTIQSLPPALLDQLINEMSTLASVYHKPPETFIGQAKYGVDAVQQAAIEYVSINLNNELSNSKQRATAECPRKPHRRGSRCSGGAGR
jgi:AP-1 complex subunit beta-1